MLIRFFKPQGLLEVRAAELRRLSLERNCRRLLLIMLRLGRVTPTRDNTEFIGISSEACLHAPRPLAAMPRLITTATAAPWHQQKLGALHVLQLRIRLFALLLIFLLLAGVKLFL